MAVEQAIFSSLGVVKIVATFGVKAYQARTILSTRMDGKIAAWCNLYCKFYGFLFTKANWVPLCNNKVGLNGVFVRRPSKLKIYQPRKFWHKINFARVTLIQN